MTIDDVLKDIEDAKKPHPFIDKLIDDSESVLRKNQINFYKSIRHYRELPEDKFLELIKDIPDTDDMIPPPEKPFLVKEVDSAGGMCPTQWSGTLSDNREFYIRYRHGTLRAEIEDETIFEKVTTTECYSGHMNNSDMKEYLKEYLDFSSAIWPSHAEDDD